ncbi:MAG: hypothetical protein HW374_1424 [Bacteroidetes bacterium]|nr:hypothetical protein [Bacteroidota bacterium]
MERRVRILLLALFLFTLLGAAVELLLTSHTEGWQLVPLILMLLSVLALGWFALVRNKTGLKLVQSIMVCFILSGAIGVLLHFNSNEEFALEVYPGLTGIELLWKSIKGAAPILAPGIMVQLGVLGLGYAYMEARYQDSEHTKEM